MTVPLASRLGDTAMLLDSEVDDACTFDAPADDHEGLTTIIVAGVAYFGLTAYACWFLFRMASGL